MLSKIKDKENKTLKNFSVYNKDNNEFLKNDYSSKQNEIKFDQSKFYMALSSNSLKIFYDKQKKVLCIFIYSNFI